MEELREYDKYIYESLLVEPTDLSQVTDEIIKLAGEHAPISPELIQRYNLIVVNKHKLICREIDEIVPKLDQKRPHREIVNALKSGHTEMYATRNGASEIVAVVRAITKKIIHA